MTSCGVRIVRLQKALGECCLGLTEFPPKRRHMLLPMGPMRLAFEYP